MPPCRLLCFDIGGTKTNAAAFAVNTLSSFEAEQQTFFRTYQNRDFTGPEEIIGAALKAAGVPVDFMVIAVAAPVTRGSVTLVNLSWTLDTEKLKNQFKVSHLFLMNDLEAVAMGIPYLKSDEIHMVNNRPAAKEGTIAVIAPGTGLGESFMTWTGDRYIAHPSEGGHCDFAPVDDLQIDLLRFLMREHSHVSYERICSGMGLYNIYRFLKEHVGMDEPAWLADQLAGLKDPAPAIVTAANDSSRPAEICRRTIDLFVSALGAEAGNLALRTLPWGGIYISGGISTHITPYFTTGTFMGGFTRKGRMRHLMEDIPVSIILNQKVALYGAARHGLGLVR